MIAYAAFWAQVGYLTIRDLEKLVKTALVVVNSDTQMIPSRHPVFGIGIRRLGSSRLARYMIMELFYEQKNINDEAARD